MSTAAALVKATINGNKNPILTDVYVVLCMSSGRVASAIFDRCDRTQVTVLSARYTAAHLVLLRAIQGLPVNSWMLQLFLY